MSASILDAATRDAVAAALTQNAQCEALVAAWAGGNVTARFFTSGGTLLRTQTIGPWAISNTTPRKVQASATIIADTPIATGTPSYVVYRSGSTDIFRADMAGLGFFVIKTLCAPWHKAVAFTANPALPVDETLAYINPPAAGMIPLAATIGDSNMEDAFRSCVVYSMLGLIGAPVKIVANSGKSGVTFQDLVTQIDELYTNGANPGLAGLPPLGMIVIQAGTNGLRNATSMPSDQAGYIATLIAKAKLLAQYVCFITMPPAGPPAGTEGTAILAGYPVVRAHLRSIAASDSRVSVFDPWGAVLDASRANIIPRFFLADRYHPSYDAAPHVGMAGAPQLEYFLSNQGFSRAPLVTNPADVYPAQPQWINNPTAAGNVSFSGVWSGNLPTGWSISTNGSGIGGTTEIVPATTVDPTDTNPVPWVRITPNSSVTFGQISLTFTASGRTVTAVDPDTLEQLLEVKVEGLQNFNVLEYWLQNNAGNKLTTVAYFGLDREGLSVPPAVLRREFKRAGSTAGGTPFIGVVYIYSVVAGSGSMGSILVRCPSVRG